MTFAWCGHLKNLAASLWFYAALIPCGIALFECPLQVPANRIGHEVMNLGQLNILQEIIALSGFVPFVFYSMEEKLTLDYLWTSLCIAGTTYFIFRRS